MARKRMIDPSFWEDEKLGSCEPTNRLLFMGLISQSDDDGRLKGHPSLIRSSIFPYDPDITNEMVETWLEKLADPEHKLIIRYEVDNQKYILIKNFKKHQTINKPQKSKLPEPLPEHYGTTTVMVHDDYVLKEEEEKIREGKLREEEVDTASADPFIQVITEFCNIHNKLDIHLKATEREDAHKLLNDGITSEFIISSMKKIHKQRTDKGEKITSLSYYKGAISDAWKGELDNEKYKGLQSQGNARESEGTTEQVGWLPSKYNTPEHLDQLPKVSGQ